MTSPRLPLPSDSATEPDEPRAPIEPRLPWTDEQPDRDELGRDGGTLKDYFRRMQERGLLD